MDEVIFVEVLDRSGRLKERARLERLPATIGRSYRNDVIVDDRFVSPEHARILRDESGDIVVEDLGSTNGVYTLQPPRKVERCVTDARTVFRIGHSLFRVRRPDDAVEPAAVERGSRVLPLESRWTSLAVFVVAACLVVALQILDTYEQIETKDIVLGLSVFVVLVLVWATVWALASRIFVHQARLREHATVATSALVALSIANLVFDVGTFALGVEEWSPQLAYLVIGTLFGAVLYGHLRLASIAAPSRLARTAIVVSILLVGLIALFGELADDEFSSIPSIPSALKPPSVRLVRAIDPEAFLLRARPLKDEVDEWVLEP